MACARAHVLALVVLAPVLIATAGPARAAEPGACLTQDQRRTAVASHRAVPLARAVRNVKSHAAGVEVVGARLCYHGEELVYVLTVLARDGKVIRASIDAASGAIIEGR
jgi:uncharacterized membrane protein YkoI